MRVLVRGGGRWARVILDVLRTQLGPADELVAISSLGAKNEGYVANIDAVAGPIDAAVIATRSHRHTADALEIIERLGPRAILVEKPVATSSAEANHLVSVARQHGCNVLVNHLATVTSYMKELSCVMADRAQPVSIDIVWADPAFETRHGETKTADWYTPITRDQGSHIWSILDFLSPHRNWRVTAARFATNAECQGLGTHVVLSVQDGSGEIHSAIRLSRFAERRKRTLSIVDRSGDRTELDFAQEPGKLIDRLTEIDLQASWATSPKPLSASLCICLKAASGRSIANILPIGPDKALRAVSFVDEAERRLQTAIRFQLAGRPSSDIAEAIELELIGPQLARAGLHLNFGGSREELIAAVAAARALMQKMR